MSTNSIPDHHPSRATRRFGYLVAVMVNAAMIYGVNRWPGWDAVPFPTADTVDGDAFSRAGETGALKVALFGHESVE